ncbi:MAG: 1,4-dihydroxy-2-naphthoate polyprenyltransferase [Bacteroidales bacterium]|nr:1,4-dihydroxy-2-naphthoate polyprenyltransferase [Bacteroidales bacterium]
MRMKVWIQAFRLRTLPLAFSCSVMGSFLAWSGNHFRWEIFLLAALTTLFLQILSNLANDFGDSEHGVDNAERVGPMRTVQGGLISRSAMKGAIAILSVLALISGSLLIFIGLDSIKQIVLFFLLGILAIVAALKYTIGKNPYGYVGLGDIFVFLFFGILGVSGTYYLHTHHFSAWVLLPAATIGLLSSGVLNLNNMRDIKNDAESGKRTLVVRLGSKGAKIYHTVIIGLSMVCSLIYTLEFYHSIFQLLFILTFPLFVMNIIVVIQNTEPKALNSELKKLAISTFIFAIIFGLGLVL